MKTPHNYKTVTLKLNRIEVCNLILATALLKYESKAEKWGLLHGKLKAILEDFDEKHPLDD